MRFKYRHVIRKIGLGTLFAAACLATASVEASDWKQLVVVPGDYDGDGVGDAVGYDRSTGTWFIERSATATTDIMQWGYNQTIPAAGDFDGDGIGDVCVYDPGTGNWYIRASATDSMDVVNWGWSRAMPAAADYDGDGVTDIAVYDRRARWLFVRNSSDGKLAVRKNRAPNAPAADEGEPQVVEIYTAYFYPNIFMEVHYRVDTPYYPYSLTYYETLTIYDPDYE